MKDNGPNDISAYHDILYNMDILSLFKLVQKKTKDLILKMSKLTKEQFSGILLQDKRYVNT